ncbi:sensor histidine kinase KdpD [Bacillus sp. JCM 19034]|uniref:sensor histidine kinase n=1 Tax=Bacillus sp. JCM 19034 TaxID=1481928 RepID=UPI000781E9ED|nr:HAMP domain-containing sensor histidine kinase [Bacillus sp. JCM 19034]
MLIVLILLLVALTAQTVYFIYYKNQIKDIGNQLAFISQNNSFKMIQTQIKPKEINQLIDLCNTLLRQQREWNQDFMKKNEEMNATIVSLSHDIRTPLTSLDGYLQLAERAQNVKEKSHYITLAQPRIKQINTLVDELFLYTKLQNRDYTLELDSIDIGTVLQKRLFSFLDEFSKRGEQPNITLPKAAVHINGNEIALERVFDNIIKNYFIHGKDRFTVRFQETDVNVLFHFSNSLNENQSIEIDKLFTRFYKEDLSRSNHSSGLGLANVKSLMEKMHGSVYAEVHDHQFCITVVFKRIEKAYKQM